ncbi:MAG: hypothetical protein N3I86_06170 [Verrucomicrobiae bacterium]|nr:hypothetical protein [Verrucomicrobiae bacterium]MDW8308797.1 hypothetical protein [Verrucomicrobiales bacterium]
MKPIRLLSALLLTSFTTAALADVVYVTARPSPSGAGPNMDGTYFDRGVDPTNPDLLNLGDTAAIANAPGRPTTGGARAWLSGSDLTNVNQYVAIYPQLAVTGGVYQIDHNFSSLAGNVSTNVIMSVFCTNGSLSVTETPVFQRSYGNPANKWSLIGYVTNDPGSARPFIRFHYKSGLVNATLQNRLLVDCFRFTLVQPCLSVPPVEVTGPLGANLTEVVVIGVTNTATAITVYQNSGSGMQPIGQKTSGIVAGANLVTVSNLIKGAQVAATQTVGGQEGCVPASGTIVGGGANPSIRVALSVRENTALTGPVGAAGSGSILHFIGATYVLSGGAPGDGVVLTPSTNWQTVTFQQGVDPVYTWFGTDPNPGFWDGDFGALDGIAIACENDAGPFEIYIDDLANGTNGVFQGWEGVPPGTVARGFSQPSFSGTTSGNLLSAPNESVVVTNTAYSGTNSCRIRFQFNGEQNTKWLRLVTSGATPVANPQVQIAEPISFKILLLPPGATPPPPPTPPQPPVLNAQLLGGQIVLNWTGTYQLQAASVVTGPYTNVVGVTAGPWTNTFTEPIKFFRLVSTP